MKRFSKVFMALIAFLSFIIAGCSAYWIYCNPVATFSSLDTGLKGAKIHNGSKTGAEYGPSTSLSSASQIKKAQSNTKQPLYLNGWLTIPVIGLERQIFEGTSDRVLSYGAGTINPNQSPDKIGNYGLAAHNYGDWNYGQGFSKLQSTGSAIIGNYAYIIDDTKLYTYKLTNYDVVYRDDSMPYTETDWNSRNMSDTIKKYGNITEKVSGDVSLVPTDTYANNNKDKTKTFTYGRTLTLYTCYELPPDYLHSWNRIIIRGVQVKEEPIPTKTVTTDSTTSNGVETPTLSVENGKVVSYSKSGSISSDNKGIKGLFYEMLSQDKQLVNKVFIASISIFVVSLISLVLMKRYF